MTFHRILRARMVHIDWASRVQQRQNCRPAAGCASGGHEMQIYLNVAQVDQCHFPVGMKVSNWINTKDLHVVLTNSATLIIALLKSSHIPFIASYEPVSISLTCRSFMAALISGTSSHTHLIVSSMSIPLSCTSEPLPVCSGQLYVIGSTPAGELSFRSR